MDVDRYTLKIVPKRPTADLLGTGGSHVQAAADIAHHYIEASADANRKRRLQHPGSD
ncbi:hypothetical protein HDC36_000295 [Xanthomonas sp. JAI131]|uniref:hypothetical protein n=1 Tax=Xanthomonas sp. JAI131 TaxID=2723067 RepID=UPI0015C6C647|nr:hypothetical protein [Xanthomonas sp. JAI131]NYF18858.1 hypothetical protein [Xanthomonas sp. JAI131]